MSHAANIVDVYKQRLARLTQANGYSSDIGNNLFEGWLAQALVADSQQPYPFLLIQPVSEEVTTESSGGRLTLTVSHEICAVERAAQGVTQRLMQHLEDMRQTLTDRNNTIQLGGTALKNTIGAASYHIPDDGYAIAWVTLQVSAQYQLIINSEN